MGKQAIDWSDWLTKLELEVIEGRHLPVKNALHELNFNHVPRTFMAPVAQLALRVSEPLLTLKILNKIVFPENELTQDATDHEKFIYASALAHLGAVNEALVLFDSINSEKEPEVHLHKALANFRIWNYTAARPLLTEFLAKESLPPYRRLIGQVNLAAALITDGIFDPVHDLLKEIEFTCRENKYFLLLGNTFELQAQVQILQTNYPKNYAEARSLLDQAVKHLETQGGEFSLYAEKWKWICLAFENRTPESIEDLRAFREKAKALGHGETVRDCDLFESIVTADEELCRKVILGTPFEPYRHRARRLFGKNISARGSYYWSLGEANGLEPVTVFDPYLVQSGGESLSTKPMLLALFGAITVDFYRPSHIGLLFQRIYEGEKFNPFSSPTRVLRLIKRLNEWFVEQNVPLQVRMKKSEFLLISRDQKPVQVLVQRTKTLSKQDGHFSQLRDVFRGRSFSAQHVSEHLQISKVSAQVLINQALKEGEIIKRGAGRATAYALRPRNKKRIAA